MQLRADPRPRRAPAAGRRPLARTPRPRGGPPLGGRGRDARRSPPGAFDRALHTTATGAGLQAAIDAVGFEGAVVELSWYGDEAVTLHLGGTFHSMRKRVLCSQVGAVAPSHRAAGHDGRRHAVLALLADPQLDALLEEPTPFARAPDVFAALYRSELATLCPYFTYS
ncbi:MAG: hypothetical protein ACON4Z_04420 [Planctomycetota bacterium]